MTASNEAQATAYRNQIENRLEKGLLPEETTYAVLPDPEENVWDQEALHFR